MENKFEQLIEFIINDEEDKAKELFHEVVVEKSREIYENLMQEDETVEEAVEDIAEETIEEAPADMKEGKMPTKEAVMKMCKEGKSKADICEMHKDCDQGKLKEMVDGCMKEMNEAPADMKEDAVDEMYHDKKKHMEDEELGGDAADDLIGEIEADEEGIALEDEEAEEELEDRVVDLEDKLDELMAEFEGLMADEEAPEAEPEGDMEMEPEAEEAESEEEAEEEMEMPMETTEEVAEEQVDEAVSMKAVKADHADHTDNKMSPTPANGGAKEKLADAHPAKVEQEKGSATPKAQDMGGTTAPDLKKV